MLIRVYYPDFRSVSYFIQDLLNIMSLLSRLYLEGNDNLLEAEIQYLV